MNRTRLLICTLLLQAATLLGAASAKAATPQMVSNWGATGVPSDISMWMYVPDNVGTNPPILVLIHYCGGTASAVFGQAQGGGIVSAADQHKFVIVMPSSGRCWDVQSNKTRTRDGGGDSHAIRQMVTYAVSSRGGNPDRVYATGDSSGGMMTELLLALYPDVFKAGSSMAGMPAGCRGQNETGSGGGYSGACAGGMVTHTAAEWGDLARSLSPGYTGHRPRVQLFHGDNDDLISFVNHGEAVKEWTNVLGLSTNPTMTDMNVPLGNHQATRQRWQSSCGVVVLDAFASHGGNHGPDDALFLSQYVIPFLGLDKPGAVDPEVQQCGSSGGAGGMGGAGAGAGGSAGASGATNGGAGGTPAAGSGGMMGGAGGAGAPAAGAGAEAGGSAGAIASAGSGGSGASDARGGAPGSGGSSSRGGGGAGGAVGAGGTFSAGGQATTGGSAGTGVSGMPSGGGPPVAPPGDTEVDDPSGCACRIGKGRSTSHLSALALSLGLAGLFSRRRRSSSRRRC